MKSRDGWSRKWDAFMRSAVAQVPSSLHGVSGLHSEGIMDAGRLGVEAYDLLNVPVGTAAAHESLKSFLYERGERYQSEMSSPITAERSCSRMSQHLTYGTISKRTVFQRFEKRRTEPVPTGPGPCRVSTNASTGMDTSSNG